jgi:hypothetical protein
MARPDQAVKPQPQLLSDPMVSFSPVLVFVLWLALEWNSGIYSAACRDKTRLELVI